MKALLRNIPSSRLPLLFLLFVVMSFFYFILVHSKVRSFAVLRVPADHTTIQAAVDAAQNGDTIFVSSGTYQENVIISDKQVTLASEFYTTGDKNFIDQTIIDAGGLDAVVTVKGSGAGGTQIIGFTIRNGHDGIKRKANMNILHNKVTDNDDGIDSSSGGAGLIQYNVFENNRDDGIDFDKDSSGIIEENTIRNNHDDGIEIRLHDYTGPLLTIDIRNNTIEGNGEDGIQLIDYDGMSDRKFRIERNLIKDSADAGLGLMDSGVSNEDFRAASIPERIEVLNNTFTNNRYAITGGDNLIAINNIIANSSVLGLKNIDGNSIVSHTLFFNNAVNQEGSNVDETTTLIADPLFDVIFDLQTGSPAIDAGTAYFVWNGEIILDYPSESFEGQNPDLGWHEYTDGATPTPTPAESEDTPTPTPTSEVTPTATATPTVTPTPGALLTFTPTDDASIYERYADKNYGSNSSLEVDGSPIKNFLIKFTVTGIGTQPVISAKLKLYNINASASGGNFYRVVDTSWNEGTVTWNTAPVVSGDIIAALGKVIKNNWYDVDVTPYITGDGTYSFRITSSSGNGADFMSSEGTASFIPQLEVTL